MDIHQHNETQNITGIHISDSESIKCSFIVQNTSNWLHEYANFIWGQLHGYNSQFQYLIVNYPSNMDLNDNLNSCQIKINKTVIC